MKFHYIALTALASMSLMLSSCLDNEEEPNDSYTTVAFANNWPNGIDDTDISEIRIDMKELNSGVTHKLDLTQGVFGMLPIGVYDFDGTAICNVADEQNGSSSEKKLRVSGRSLTITAPSQINLDWFFESSSESLLFSEIYATGSPNATATGGLRDTYIRIYNNSDEVVYADGIGIAESAFVNARTNTFEILTEANDRQVNFTAGTIWVIPGSGTDYPIRPGESIKIVDQAIDWSAQVGGALNHTDADFEWHDDHAQDTDNPSVPNLEKWYCYSNTIWVISNQCNRSYALIKFPEGMTAEQYLAEYPGGYDYIHTTGAHMHNDKAYLIPNEWILDGVNLGVGESYVYGALGNSIDLSYAKISDYTRDPNRFGNVFRRKVATLRSDNTFILQDTNDSAFDFELANP